MGCRLPSHLSTQAIVEVSTMRGEGSKGSPIVISDDEDDVSTVQREHSSTSFLENPNGNGHHNDIDTEVTLPVAPKGMKMMLNMGYTPGLGLGRHLDGQVEPVPLVLKRKRDEAGLGSDRRSPSPTRLILEKLDGAFIKLEKRKAGKKRRKLEHEILGPKKFLESPNTLEHPLPPLPQMALPESKPPTWQNHGNPGTPLAALNPWQNSSLPFNSFQFPHASGANWPSRPITSAHSLPQVPFSLQVPFIHDQSNGTSPGTSVSAPFSPTNAGLPAKPAFGHGSLAPQSAFQPLLPMSRPGPSHPPEPSIPPQPNKLFGPKQSASALRSMKKVSSKGMRSDSSFFQKPPSTHPVDGHPHIFDPTRTLVLDQMPKSRKNRQAILMWCRKSCGTIPVRLQLHAAKKEAILEFENAEVARTMYSSPLPECDPDPGGRATKRFWYGTQNTERGDGEIEEGEIEEKSATQWKKWLRKEKKIHKKTSDDQEPAQITQPEVQVNGGSNTEHQASIQPTQLPFRFQWQAVSPIRNRSPEPLPLDESVGPRDEFNSNVSSIHEERDRFLGVNGKSEADDTSIALSRPASPLAHSSLIGMENEFDLPVSDKFTLTFKPAIRSSVTDKVLETPMSGMGIRSTDCQPVSSATANKKNATILSSIPRPPPSQPRHTPTPAVPPSFSTPVSNSYPSSRSTSTPTLEIPSEPRAMKHLSKGPNNMKGSFKARRREIEERITSVKVEHENTSGLLTLEGSAPATLGRHDAIKSSVLALQNTGVKSREIAVEDHLRRLVLESKRKKALRVAAKTDASVSEIEPASSTMSHSTDMTSKASKASGGYDSPVPSSGSDDPMAQNGLALEELAVSFITETIQAIKPSPASVKLELVARQQQLEKEIAESKLLMARLTSAQTKQEKDEILRVMRERIGTTAKSESKPISASSTTVILPSESQTSRIQPRIRWPESTQDGVLIVSDEEDDEV